MSDHDQQHRFIIEKLDDGFTGVHKRLDKLNGRVEKHADEIVCSNLAAAKVENRLEHVEVRPAPLTRRDSAVVIASIMAVVAALKLLGIIQL